MVLPHLDALAFAMPLDGAVRLNLCEGIPTFRAAPRIQERIEELLEKQAEATLSSDEERELDGYEELDAFLSLVNRLVRATTRAEGRDDRLARTA